MLDHAGRRARIGAQLENGVLILVAAPERTRSNDTEYVYRQDSDFAYFTGFPEPEAVMVFAPKSDTPYTLFVRPRDKSMEIWYGRRQGPKGAIENYGADAAYEIGELAKRMPELLAGHERVYYSLGRSPNFDQRLLGWIRQLGANRKNPNRAPLIIQDPRPMMHRMRWIKSPAELEVMAKAAAISAEGHRRAMAQTRPGMYEYQIQGIIESYFVSQGARSPSYNTIAAGGDNANILHYVENDQVLRDGELILVDAGAEYDWYAGDITRTWPVGKRFTAPQRDLYQAVLEAQIRAVDRVRLGTSNADLHTATIRDLTEAMVHLGLLKMGVDEAIETEAFKRYYMHGTGHYIGIDVHDVGPYYDAVDVGTPYEEGVVVTIEPGLYVSADDEEAPEHFRGIGIRIEDDVVVTDGDPRVLTGGVPKTIDEIEALKQG